MLQKLQTNFYIVFRYLKWYTAELVLSFLITFVVGILAIWSAYLERGYCAIGGEYFLIAFTWYVSYKVIHIIFCFWRRKNANRGKKGGSTRTSRIRYY